MGRLSKAQITRRNATRKGGRGRKIQRIPESPIKTPLKPKTTAWRERSKAAAAQQVLYRVALANIRWPISSRPSTANPSSRPSTAGPESSTPHTATKRPNTGYSVAATAGSAVSTDSRSNDGLVGAVRLVVGRSTPAVELEIEDEDEDEENGDFEDMDDVKVMVDPISSVPLGNKDQKYNDAIKCWPRVQSLEMRMSILKSAMIDLTKLMASKRCPAGHDYYWHLQVLQFMNWQIIGLKRRLKKAHVSVPTRMACALNVAIGFQKGQRVQERILRHEKIWIQQRRIPASQQGKNAKMMCMLEDEGTMTIVQECIAGAGANFRAHMLAAAVTKYWQSSQPDIDRRQQLQLFSDSILEVEQHEDTAPAARKKLTLSARTAVNWLHRMGYSWKEVKKGIYKDGHERPDVLAYRETFLNTLKELESRMPYPVKNEKGEVVDIEFPPLAPGATLCIPVTHDECTCNANDGPHHQWIKGDEHPIRKKSRGQGLHISEFITPWGRLRIGEEEVSDEELLKMGLDKREATEIIQCGGDIWWNQEHIVQQTLTAITVFEAAYPGVQALFLFDNATSHSSYAEDALRASKMNKGWGGQQPHMRDGYFHDRDGNKVLQKMSYQRDQDLPKYLWGEAKGLQAILEERDLWPAGGLYLDCTTRKNIPKDQRKHSSSSSSCCARRLLSQQPDFKAQKGRVQEVVEARGHMVLFYPKFHCELNWIEYYWARVKLYTRTHCGYNIKSLRENVPAALIWAADLIPKWWGKSLRIMDTYRDGVSYGTEEFVARAYTSHRRVDIRDANSL